VSRPNWQWSRRSLLWAALCFCLAHLLAGLLLDYHWPQVRFPEFQLVLDELDSMRPGPDIVFVGSSRFGYGLNRDILESHLRSELGDQRLQVLLAMVPAGDCIYADYFVERLLERGRLPRLLVVEVAPETVACRNRWLQTHAARQFTWLDAPHFFWDACRADQVHRLLQARLLPLVVHRQQMCQVAWQQALHLGTSNPAPRSRGVVWVDLEGLDQDARTRTARGADFIAEWLTNYQPGGAAAEALEQVVKRCRERGITVVLVAPPVNSQQRTLYLPCIEEAFRAYMARLMQTYGCHFVDDRKRLPDALFFDNHHLLPEGAQRFSHLIVDELLSNGLPEAL
jgi:hypothetical protein